MVTTTAPALTIADLADENEAFESMIEAARPYGCKFIAFMDAYYGGLKFRVSVVAYHEFDHDGCNPFYETHTLTIAVTPTMSLETAVGLLIGCINSLIED